MPCLSAASLPGYNPSVLYFGKNKENFTAKRNRLHIADVVYFLHLHQITQSEQDFKSVVSEIHKVGIKRVPYENCFVQRENEYV